jgi:hypothetical protein
MADVHYPYAENDAKNFIERAKTKIKYLVNVCLRKKNKKYWKNSLFCIGKKTDNLAK